PPRRRGVRGVFCCWVCCGATSVPAPATTSKGSLRASAVEVNRYFLSRSFFMSFLASRAFFLAWRISRLVWRLVFSAPLSVLSVSLAVSFASAAASFMSFFVSLCAKAGADNPRASAAIRAFIMVFPLKDRPAGRRPQQAVHPLSDAQRLRTPAPPACGRVTVYRWVTTCRSAPCPPASVYRWADRSRRRASTSPGLWWRGYRRLAKATR